MNRNEIITKIFSLKPEAVNLGFDFPSEEITDSVTTHDLHLFLGEVETFLYFEKE
jgi:hypothetical protein